MALTFGNCLTPQADGSNSMYGECCCDFTCTVTTNEAVTIENISVSFVNEFFSINGGTKIYIGGVQQSFPVVLNAEDSFEVEFQICAGLVGQSDTITYEFLFSTGSEKIYFDFDAIDLSTSVNQTFFDFGDVIVGQTNTLELEIQNPTVCCYEYAITTTLPETIITPDVTSLLCQKDSQSGIKLDFKPTIEGAVYGEIFVSVGCQTWSIDGTGKGITQPEPPTGGTTVTQKNKVDQTTRVEGCSPRTANNRCQTARTMQSAIRTNARRFGKR